MWPFRFGKPDLGEVIGSALGAALGGSLATLVSVVIAVPWLYSLVIMGAGAALGYSLAIVIGHNRPPLGRTPTTTADHELEETGTPVEKDEDYPVEPIPYVQDDDPEPRALPAAVAIEFDTDWRDRLAEALYGLLNDPVYHVLFDPTADPSRGLLGVELHHVPSLAQEFLCEDGPVVDGRPTKVCLIQHKSPENFAEALRIPCAYTPFEQGIAEALAAAGSGTRAQALRLLVEQRLLTTKPTVGHFEAEWIERASTRLLAHSTRAVREELEVIGTSIDLSAIRYRDERSREIYRGALGNYIRGSADVLNG